MQLTPTQVNEFVARVYPATREIGVRCESIGEGFAQVRWTLDPRALRPGGLISGPTQFSAADLALWCLSFTVVGLAAMAVTSDLHITFLRPASGGDLLARADLLRAGKTRIVGRVALWVDGAEERPVSHASGTYALLGTA
ncbi:MAG TPA: PaaI family thioesterase [Kofleriaceae bacterium]|nr:PaaI family thioesterase [Kofleriaceae bacterium]